MAAINRADFLRALEMVQPGLSPRETTEQSTHFVFRKGRVITYNGEVACTCPSGLDKSFEGAVVAQKFLDIIRKIPDESLEQKKSNHAFALAGKRKGLQALLEKNITMPIGDQVEQPKDFRPLPPKFGEAIGMVQACACKAHHDVYRMCVHIAPNWVEACDSTQIARYSMETGFGKSILVHRDSIAPTAALGMDQACETESWIHLKNQDDLVYSIRKKIDDFPDLTDLFKVKGKRIVLPTGLEEVLARCEVPSSENAESNAVLVEITPTSLRVTGRGVTLSYTETLSTKKSGYDGEPFTFLISPQLMSSMVKKNPKAILSDNILKIKGEDWAYLAYLANPEAADKREEEENVSDEVARSMGVTEEG